MTKNIYSLALLLCLSLLLSQCSQEEVPPSNDVVRLSEEDRLSQDLKDYNARVQAQRTDAFIIYADVAYNCQDVDCEGYDYVFEMSGHSISMQVDWGDGTLSGNSSDERYRFEHTYAKRGRYFITVTGTLANVTGFEPGSYGLGNFRAINFAALPNLEVADLSGIGSITPVTIDLTKNPALKYVSAPGGQYVRNLVLPHRHYVSEIHIDGPSALDASDVDKIISNIYINTVSRNIRDGNFTLRAHIYQDDDYAMMGPPSEASLAKHRILRDSYNWRVYPLDGRPFEWQ
jgi:hypothetical protein